ncbi:MAG: EscU/YscU/HrcU family type III secretion system export apparatus switch protein [Polyangiaceae bacterium]
MKEKTEPPSPRRLRKARAQGDHAISQPLIGALTLGAAAVLLPSAGRAVASELEALLRRVLQDPTPPSVEELLRPALSLSLPLLGVTAAAALASGLLQTGGALSLEPLRWDWQRLNPFRRLSELGSGAGLFAALHGLVAVVGLVALGYVLVTRAAAELPAAMSDAGNAAQLCAALASRLLGLAALLLLALGALDWLAARQRWLARHRMTRDEVAREQRENDGDPEIKRLRQRAHREWLAGGELGEAARAALIVVGPPRWAIALSYDPSSDAPPRVLIQAPGALGRALVLAASGFRVPIWHDPELAQRLAGVAPGDSIPRAEFTAVANALVASSGAPTRR